MSKFKYTLVFFFIALFALPVQSQTPQEGFYLDSFRSKIDAGEVDEAMQVLNVGLTDLPESSYLLAELADVLFFSGDIENTLVIATSALEKAEDEDLIAHLYSCRGGANFQIMRAQQAFDDFSKACELKPNNLDYLSNLAMACGELGKLDEALEYLRKIVELDPEHVPGWTNLGFSYQELEKYEESLEFFDKAIELDPESGYSYSNRSYSRLKSGDVEGAMDDIEKAIEYIPTNSWAFKVKALILLEKGKNRPACKALETAIELGYTKQFGDEVLELQKEHCQ